MPRKNGEPVEMRNFAQIERATTPSRIDRIDPRQRAANVRASVGPGYALATGSRRCAARLQR